MSRPRRHSGPYGAVSDQQLLRLALARSEAGWLELMRRHRNLIYGCIHRTLGRYGVRACNETADDIFSDVCMRLLHNDMRRLRAYDPERGCKLSSWIGLIAVNAAHDHLRSRARTPTVDTIDGRADHADSCPSPLEQLLHRERSVQLRRLANQLSSKDRDFLDLYVHRELSPKEIARRMRVSVKTVYSCRSRIERRLANLVETPRSAASQGTRSATSG